MAECGSRSVVTFFLKSEGALFNFTYGLIFKIVKVVWGYAKFGTQGEEFDGFFREGLILALEDRVFNEGWALVIGSWFS